jgi:hypothetical protein
MSLALCDEVVSAAPTPQPEQMKISPRLLHVARNLFSQRVHRRKFDLIPQSLEEADLNLSVRGKFQRMEIQQMGLNREQFVPKSWPIPHVRH